jgi:hypothetical protein
MFSWANEASSLPPASKTSPVPHERLCPAWTLRLATSCQCRAVGGRRNAMPWLSTPSRSRDAPPDAEALVGASPR